MKFCFVGILVAGGVEKAESSESGKLPQLAAGMRENEVQAANAVVISSAMIGESGELKAGNNYVAHALSGFPTSDGKPTTWKVFQEGYPGIDAQGAGLDLRALLGQWPLLTLVETTAGDHTLSETEITTGLESLLRNNGKREPRPWEKPKHLITDFVFVHSATPKTVAAHLTGNPVPAIETAERVAAHYGIPTFDAAKVLADAVAAGEVKQEELFTSDGSLSEKGHRRVGAALGAKLNAALRETPAESPDHLPEILASKGAIEAPRRYPYERADYDEGWLDWQESPLARFYHVLRDKGSGGVITIEVKGRLLAAQVLVFPDSGDLEVSVDEGPWAKCPVFRAIDGIEEAEIRTVVLASGLDPEKAQRVKVRVASEIPDGSNGREMAIAWFFADGEIVNPDPLEGLSPIEVADAIYATMKPVAYEPSSDRWTQLQKSKERLANGEGIRMVTLGDSIINDMRGSNFEHLLMREWPGSTVQLFNSVRGSTGCWFYAEEGNVEEYITKHRPDLLVIGGISHRNDAEAVRSVIRQTREKLPDVEILLLTGPFGWPDPVGDPNWREKDRAFNASLEKIAYEENAGFFDLQSAWADYIVNEAGALDPFKRDVVHANDRGKQLLGRLLVRHLGTDPSKPKLTIP